MAQPPYLALIAERFGEAVEDLGFGHGVHAFAAPPELIVDLCRFLKEHPDLRFNFLSDIAASITIPRRPATRRSTTSTRCPTNGASGSSAGSAIRRTSRR